MSELNHHPKRILNAFILIILLLSYIFYLVFSNHNILFAEANYLMQKDSSYEKINIEDYVPISASFFPEAINAAGYTNGEAVIIICDMKNPTVSKNSFIDFESEALANGGTAGKITTVEASGFNFAVSKIDSIIFLEFMKDKDKSNLFSFMRTFEKNRFSFLIKMIRNVYDI